MCVVPDWSMDSLSFASVPDWSRGCIRGVQGGVKPETGFKTLRGMTASGLSYKTAKIELEKGTTVRPCQSGEAVCTVRRNPGNADEEAKEVMRFGPGDSFGERALLAGAHTRPLFSST